MARSYNLKKSPINKGYAAKPSPTRFVVTPLVIGIASAMAGSAVAGGISAASSAAGRRKAEKVQKESEARQLKAEAAQGLGSKKIGTSSKIA